MMISRWGFSLLILCVGINAYAVQGGSNIGSTDRGSKFMIEWCRGNVGALEDARSSARLFVLDGDFAAATDILMQGFVAAAGQMPEGSKDSLVYRMITRTLQMGEALTESESPSVARFNLFDTSIDLIQSVIAPIDTAYYIPSRFERRENTEAEFERRFEVMARQEIDWFINTFSTLDAFTGAALPRYSPKTYLVLLELVTSFVAADLSDSLWQARYACSAEQLTRLSARLAAYNAGNAGGFVDDRRAIVSATAEVIQIRNRIGQCGRN